MADKQHSDTLEKIESIYYAPTLQDSGDLEAGTHTIVPTSRPAIGSAQYSKSLTLPKPDDARLEVKRIAARLSVNIAGLGTATTVYCAVRVDVDDADHELFNLSWTSTGAKLAAVDTHSGAKSTIFNLLKDGAAHTFYFLFWADAANQATINVVQLWEAVGTCSTTQAILLDIDFKGVIDLFITPHILGTGSPSTYLVPPVNEDWAAWSQSDGDGVQLRILAHLTSGEDTVRMKGTVGTDLNYVHKLYMNLRSEQ